MEEFMTGQGGNKKTSVEFHLSEEALRLLGEIQSHIGASDPDETLERMINLAVIVRDHDVQIRHIDPASGNVWYQQLLPL